jgi:hypothetical protein
MCDECLTHIHTAIAVPLETTDDGARRTFNYLYDVMDRYVELLIRRKRVQPILALVPASRWACAVGCTDEQFSTLFLTGDPEVVDSAIARLPEAGSRVDERW